MRLALYQPEIPQNTGTLMRLGACLGVGIDIIEPCGFVFNDQKLKRAGMDYIELANITKHVSWESYYQHTQTHRQRVVLIDVAAPVSFLDFKFETDDVLMVGRESDGVPESVYHTLVNKVTIPMCANRRSLNVAIAASIVLTEALRQTHLFKG